MNYNFVFNKAKNILTTKFVFSKSLMPYLLMFFLTPVPLNRNNWFRIKISLFSRWGIILRMCRIPSEMYSKVCLMQRLWDLLQTFWRLRLFLYSFPTSSKCLHLAVAIRSSHVASSRYCKHVASSNFLDISRIMFQPGGS